MIHPVTTQVSIGTLILLLLGLAALRAHSAEDPCRQQLTYTVEQLGTNPYESIAFGPQESPDEPAAIECAQPQQPGDSSASDDGTPISLLPADQVAVAL